MSPAALDRLLSTLPAFKQAAVAKPKLPTHESKEDDVPADVDTIMASTEKLLAISRGLADTDDRDSLQFRRIHTLPDLLNERIHLDADKLLRTAMRRLAKQRSLKVLHVDHFGPYASGLIVGHPLSSPLEEINPMHLAEQARRITALGPGGINSSDAVTEDAQNVNPTQFGFFSALETPECFSADTFVYTQQGWVAWPEVSSATVFACNVEGRLEFHKAERLVAAPYAGEMIGFESKGFNFLVTPNHRMFSAGNGKNRSDYTWMLAEEQFGRNYRYKATHQPWTGSEVADYFELPSIQKRNNNQKVFAPIPMRAFAAFMGYYLAEGSLMHSNFVTRISKCKAYDPEVHAKIVATLNSCGFSAWSYNDKAGDFHIPGVQLYDYLNQFGRSGSKFIPEILLCQTVEVRAALLEALMDTDSRITATTSCYVSTSKRLSLDVQRLMISLGYPTSFREEPDRRPHVKSTNWCAGRLKKLERTSSCNGIYGKWVRKEYSGVVYCATVTGGMLLTRRGRGNGFWSGNSEKAGVDVRQAWGTKLGTDGRIYQNMLNRRTGKQEWVSPADLADKVVGLPD